MTRVSDQLLDGALAQFRTHGFAKTSMSDIARAAGVSRTALYNHFDTKEAVFRALSDRINARVTDAVMQAAGSDGPWQDRLARVVHARCEWVYDLLHDGAFGRELIDEKNRMCGGRVLMANDRFARLLADILKSGGSSPAEAKRLASVLIAAVNGILETAATRRDAQADVDLLVTTLSRGLSA
ncbi:MAG: TetR/AcrR family transcriptional regulator [Hyphomonas sp.]|nr:TetR/AcrR family transcriptional regulator [Hyphomonas sp.]